MKRRLSLDEQLAIKPAVAGLLLTQSEPALAEIAAISGYDFILLDGEHGTFMERDMYRILQIVGNTDTLIAIRIAGRDTEAVGRYLDMGADIIVVPNVSLPEQARALVSAMEYPPRGTRGFGAAVHRVTRYGADVTTHLRDPRAGASLLVIIESALGVSNVDEILAVAGIDGVIVGPADLSADLGQARNFAQPAYAEAISRVEQAAISRRKILGTAPHPGFSMRSLFERGHRFLITGADVSLIREAMTAQVSEAHLAIGRAPFDSQS